MVFRHLTLCPDDTKFCQGPRFGVWQYHFVSMRTKTKFNKLINGEMSEWSNVPAWKASIPQGIGGSNPLLSAKNTIYCGFTYCINAIYSVLFSKKIDFLGKIWGKILGYSPYII